MQGNHGIGAPSVEGSPIADGTFGVSAHRIEGGIVVAVRGELDLATAPLVEDELRRAAEAHALIVLDLRELEFMDSTGLQMTLQADRRARELGRRLLLLGVRPQVRRLLELTQTESRLSILEDPAELPE